MDSSLFSLCVSIISFILTIVSTVLAIYFYNKTKRIKYLSIAHNATVFSIYDNNLIQLLYKGEHIDKITFTTLYFYNNGNISLYDRDFTYNAPLKIITDNTNDKIIAFNTVLGQNGAKIKTHISNNEIIIIPEYINPQASFTLNIYSTGSECVSVCGDLIEGKINTDLLLTSKNTMYYIASGYVISAIMFFTMYMPISIINIIIFLLFLFHYLMCIVMYFFSISKAIALQANKNSNNK